MPLALKRYKDGTYIPLFKPTVRRIKYGETNKDISKYPKDAQDSIRSGLRSGTVHFENTDDGGEYISGPKKKKKGFVSRIKTGIKDEVKQVLRGIKQTY